MAVDLPMNDDASINCDLWIQEEEQNNYTSCENELANWYGCPKQTNGVLIDGEIKTDAFWAELEVNYGITGWEYDICCNPVDSETRWALKTAKYCDSLKCEYNRGADFCIRSPRILCPASIGREQRLVFSNLHHFLNTSQFQYFLFLYLRLPVGTISYFFYKRVSNSNKLINVQRKIGRHHLAKVEIYRDQTV